MLYLLQKFYWTNKIFAGVAIVNFFNDNNLFVELPKLSISAVHIPFLVSDPDKHLVDMMSIWTTPLLDDRWNPHTHNSGGKGF